jgi:hypothetical protein
MLGTGTWYSRGLVPDSSLTENVENSCERTIFAHISERIDAVMYNLVVQVLDAAAIVHARHRVQNARREHRQYVRRGTCVDCCGGYCSSHEEKEEASTQSGEYESY